MPPKSCQNLFHSIHNHVALILQPFEMSADMGHIECCQDERMQWSQGRRDVKNPSRTLLVPNRKAVCDECRHQGVSIPLNGEDESQNNGEVIKP